jgi:hypothetical protein
VSTGGIVGAPDTPLHPAMGKTVTARTRSKCARVLLLSVFIDFLLSYLRLLPGLWHKVGI